MTIKTFDGARAALGKALGKIGDGYADTVPPLTWAMIDAVGNGDATNLSTMYQDVAIALPPSMAKKFGTWVAKAIVEITFDAADGFKCDGNYAAFTFAEGFEFSKVPAWYIEVKKPTTDKVYGWNELSSAAARQADLLIKLAAGDKPRGDDVSMVQLGYMQAAYRRLIADLADIKGGTYGAAAAPATPATNVVDLPATGTNG